MRDTTLILIVAEMGLAYSVAKRSWVGRVSLRTRHGVSGAEAGRLEQPVATANPLVLEPVPLVVGSEAKRAPDFAPKPRLRVEDAEATRFPPLDTGVRGKVWCEVGREPDDQGEPVNPRG